MQLGMIGLGRMGANMVRRLLKGGHECVVFDMSAKTVSEMVKEKAIGSASLAEFAKKLTKPRAVWLMVPAGVVDKSIADLKSTYQKAKQDLEWKEREVALLGLDEKAMRESARTDADERLTFRTD